MSLGDALQLLAELLHGPLSSRLDPVPHRSWAHRHPAGPAQQRGCGGKRYKDGERTAQALELSACALMGLDAQFVVQGSHLRGLAPLGTPSDPSLPPDRTNEADDLAPHKAFTAHACSTLRAAGPRCRATGAFGQHRFDKAYGEDTRQRPYRQDQLWECAGLFNRTEQTLHEGIIIAYAVAEA